MEEESIHELKEKFDQLEGFEASWSRYLALTTACIAVIAAIASLQSGNYANRAILEKNDAVLLQAKASDQWAYYQAKGIKKNIAEALSQKDASRYASEQQDIQKQAQEYERQRDEANVKAEHLLERHHKTALGVTFFQIAIALSAMSALLKRRSFWMFSLVLTLFGLWFFVVGVAG